MKKIFCSAMFLIVVLNLPNVFAAGPQEEMGAVAAEGAVQYGGTLTYLNYFLGARDMTHPDLCASGIVRNYVMPYVEALIKGDIEKYGPRGSNEYGFTHFAETPYEYQSGQLSESWEVHADKLIFKLRQGVKFYADHVNFMETREMTADDVAFSLKRWIEAPTGRARIAYATNVYADGKYTVVIETNAFNFAWFFWLGNYGGSGVVPPEVVKAGVEDWGNQVGTGPFVLTSAVKGSQATYDRNPVYWDKTTIDGKEYQLPFVDKLVIPVIVDEITTLSALRTGKLDGLANLSVRYADELTKRNPEIIQANYSPGQHDNIYFQCRGSSVFADINVRRAVAIGTDRQELVDNVYDGHAASYFVGGGPGFATYTPLDQAPQAVRELYEYNPQTAKKMLADAGHPNGFEVEFVYTPDLPYLSDIVSVISSQWQKIGLTVKPVTLDLATYKAKAAAYDFSGVLIQELSPTPRGMDLLLSTGVRNYAGLVYEPFDTAYKKASTMVDAVERNVLLKSAFMDWMSQASQIIMPAPYTMAAWWPWVKNYFGEINVGFGEDMTPMLARMWIDQGLKSKMGY